MKFHPKTVQITVKCEKKTLPNFMQSFAEPPSQLDIKKIRQ